MMMRAQMGESATNYITNVPNMSAYEVGFDMGFASEKVGESIVLSKGAGLGANVIRNGLGYTAFNSAAIGGESFLFGRAYLGSFGGQANGILNRGYFRLGWSFNKGTHLFQPRIGPKYGAWHGKPWLIYKP